MAKTALLLTMVEHLAMLAMPGPTPYDLRFHLAGIPIRVHPLFWLMATLIAWTPRLEWILAGVAVIFISILVHELGHGLAGRLFGSSTEITLFLMGGLCAVIPMRPTTWQRTFVLAAGPGAGLLLALLTLLGVILLDGRLLYSFNGMVFIQVAFFEPRFGSATDLLQRIFTMLILVNIVWSLFNLLPIWPLDGGRLAGEFFQLFGRDWGTRVMHGLSLGLCVCAVAFFLLIWSQSGSGARGLFQVAFFGFLALENYNQLQRTGSGWNFGGQDSSDWWRRS